MTLQEAKTLFKKHAGETIESWGFKEKKIRSSETIYKKTKENGFETFGVRVLNYMPRVRYGIGALKRLNLIEDILSEINTKYALNLKLDKETFTIACRKNERELDIALPGVEDEQGVIESSKILLDYIGNTALPMFNLFDDIREIDKRINGEAENWGEQKDFTLGPIYGYRSWIIARLSKTNNDFDIFFNKWVIYANKRIETEKLDSPFLNPNDETQRTIQIFKFLRESVSPIY